MVTTKADSMIEDRDTSKSKLPLERRFREFFNKLILESDPKFIVSISRKGPRLLECIFKGSTTNLCLISEKAIDFLPDASLRDQKVILFDDMVIWGSTMALVRRKLLARGCKVNCVSYATSAPSFLGEAPDYNPSPYKQELDLNYFLKLSERESSVFCNTIVNLICGSGKPYELDYPIFRMRLSDSYDPIHVIERRWQERLSKLGKTYNVTTLAHRQNAILAFSILSPLSKIWSPFDTVESGIVLDLVQKCRVYVNIRDGYVNIVPMAIVKWNNDKRLPKYAISNAVSVLQELTTIAQNVHDADSPGASWDRDQHGCDQELFVADAALAEFRALIFTHNLFYGIAILKKFTELSSFRELIQNEKFELDYLDLQYLFGPVIAKHLIEDMTNLYNNSGNLGNWLVERAWEYPMPKELDSQEVYKEFRAFQENNHFEAGFSLNLDRNFDVEENLNRVCRSMHYVIDTQRRDDNNDGRRLSRLRRGLSYSDILYILNEAGINFSVDTFSQAIDLLNDSGMLVPINMLIGDRRLRGCRNGENDPKYLSFPLFTREAMTWQKNQSIPFTKSSFHKIFSILSELFPEELENVGSISETRGPIAVYISPLHPEQRQNIIEYLSLHGVISVQSGKPSKPRAPIKDRKKESYEPEKPRLL